MVFLTRSFLNVSDLKLAPKDFGSIANYENLDNYVHGIHDYQKYLKFGFSRAMTSCNLIRRGLLTREDTVHLVSENDGLFHLNILTKI